MRLGYGASSSPLVRRVKMTVVDLDTDSFSVLQPIAPEADRGCMAT